MPTPENDVTFVEGPILRQFHLSTLKLETAGHSTGQANDMNLTGNIEAHEFRNRILAASACCRIDDAGFQINWQAMEYQGLPLTHRA